MLIILGGLPGTGKTTLSKELACRLSAFHLRIDSIEQAIKNSSAGPLAMEDSGYRVAYALAEDNLRLGRSVIADSVNPIALTRDAWREVAVQADAKAIEIEVVCSVPAEHRRRVEARLSDIPGLRLPSWHDVLAREYEPWDSADLVIDTAFEETDLSVARIYAALVHIRSQVWNA